MEERIERTFNKDIAFLMEIQRLEIISNNYAIESNHKARVNALRCWAGALWGILLQKEKTDVDILLDNCNPLKQHGKTMYDIIAINELHRLLNTMNTKHKLQMTSIKTGAEAAKIV